MRSLPLFSMPHLFQSQERRVGRGGYAGWVAAETEARARGGVLEAGEHPPVHEEEEGHEGAPAQQPAARAPPRLAPPPRPQQHGGWIWISGGRTGGEGFGGSGKIELRVWGAPERYDRCGFS